MDNALIADKLTRALAMEETMSGLLVELCSSSQYTECLPSEIKDKVLGILNSIKEDTAYHKETVFLALAKYKAVK